MYPHICHVFIDGGYVRALGDKWKVAAVDPLKLAKGIAESTLVQTWAHNPTTHPNTLLGRVTYYDALPADDKEPKLQDYWRA